MNYLDTYHRALNDPVEFWGEASSTITWDKPWHTVLDDTRSPFTQWFCGGYLNTCYNCVDRHVISGNGDRVAIYYDSPVSDRRRAISYRNLLSLVEKFSGVLTSLGVVSGERVIIYMPMVPETIVAMLACARIGAIHSVVFGGFAAKELAIRIDDSKPRVVVAASCGIEPTKVIKYKPLLDAAIDLAAHKPEKCVIFQRPEALAEMRSGRDLDWSDCMAGAHAEKCLSLPSEHPLYILYTSGTTGIPKGVVRTNGGHAVALSWSMSNIYGVKEDDVYWAASDVGWVVGHSYIVYGPLLHGCSTVLFEGKPVGTPDAAAFWRIVERYGVNVMFTAPTAIRAIKREDPEGSELTGFDLSSLRTLFLAGERCDPATLHWSERQLGVPVIDHWWQTETGWPIAANPMGIEKMPVKPGSPSVPVPGYNISVLDDNGQSVPANESGNIVVRLPLPPGTLSTLWNDDERFVEAYFATYPGYYLTSDAGHMDSDGYLWVMSRIDDIINVAGHRLSTGAMEEVICNHSDVAECAVVGVKDALKGEVPLCLAVLNHGCPRDEIEIAPDLVAAVRKDIGPVASFKLVCLVPRLPKTRSGKVLRGSIKKIADNDEFVMPATIDDPAIFDEIRIALKRMGFPRIGNN